MTTDGEQTREGLLHKPKNRLRIDCFWAFVSVDQDGNEGVAAAEMLHVGRPMMMPLAAASRQRLKSLRPQAELVAKCSKMAVKLVKISMREEIETIKPREPPDAA